MSLYELYEVILDLKPQVDAVTLAATVQLETFELAINDIAPNVQAWVDTSDHDELGWSKLNGKWTLAYRRKGGNESRPLSNTSRIVRFQAVHYLNRLANSIARHQYALLAIAKEHS